MRVPGRRRPGAPGAATTRCCPRAPAPGALERRPQRGVVGERGAFAGGGGDGGRQRRLASAVPGRAGHAAQLLARRRRRSSTTRSPSSSSATSWTSYGGRENADALLAEQATASPASRPTSRLRDDLRGRLRGLGRRQLPGRPGRALRPPGVDAHDAASTHGRRPGDGERHGQPVRHRLPEVDSPAAGAIFTFDGADEVTIGMPSRYDGAVLVVEPRRRDRLAAHPRGRPHRARRRPRCASAPGTTSSMAGTTPTWRPRTDGGETWAALPGKHTTDDNPWRGLRPGYTGESDGEWVEEEVDLTRLRRAKRSSCASSTSPTTPCTLTASPWTTSRSRSSASADGADSDGGWQAEGFRRIDGPAAAASSSCR